MNRTAPIRIAMVTSDYLPNIGGIASHIVELSRAMVRQGQHVEVWVWDPAERPKQEIIETPTIMLRIQQDNSRLRLIRMAKRLAERMQSEIRRFQPAILHCHTTGPSCLAFRYLGPAQEYCRIFTNHSSGYLSMIRSWIGRRKARFQCSGVDGLLAPSEELLKRSALLKLDPSRTRYVPNGVDPDLFRPGSMNAARNALKIAPDRKVILATRRFAVKNGLRYLAQAMDEVRREVPQALCIFCGDASDNIELPAVQDIVREYGLDDYVRFEGAILNTRIGTYLNAADVVVLPSLMEATSISGLEAMSAGKMLVGTRVGGIPAIIKDGETGLLVKPADRHDLATALVKALVDCDSQSMGRAAREFVLEEFSWDSVAERTLAFYDHVRKLPPNQNRFLEF